MIEIRLQWGGIWGVVIPAIGGVNIRQDVSRPGGRNMLAAVTFSKI